MRKLNELYGELRQIHRRLEVDLQGVRETPEYDHGATDHREIEIQTLGRAGKRPISRAAQDHHERIETRVTSRALDTSERISVQRGRECDERSRPPRPSSRAAPSHQTANSAPLDTLLALAPNRESRPFNLNRGLSREIEKGHRHRARSALTSDIREGEEENEDSRYGKNRR